MYILVKKRWIPGKEIVIKNSSGTSLFLNLLIVIQFLLWKIIFHKRCFLPRRIYSRIFPNVCLQSPLRFLSHCKNSSPSQLLLGRNFQYIPLPLPRRNPSSRVSHRFKCVSVAGSFASHVSKVNNAIRVRAKVTGRQKERQTGEESTFLPSLFSLSRGKYVEYLNKSKQPKWFSNLN